MQLYGDLALAVRVLEAALDDLGRYQLHRVQARPAQIERVLLLAEDRAAVGDREFAGAVRSQRGCASAIALFLRAALPTAEPTMLPITKEAEPNATVLLFT